MSNFRYTLSLTCIFLFFTRLPVAFAQWEIMDGPHAGYAIDIVEDENAVYIVNFNGVYRSVDGVSNWTLITENIPDGLITLFQVHGNEMIIRVSQALPLIQDNDYLYLSSDGGQHWKGIPMPVMENFYPSQLLLLEDKIVYANSGLIWDLPLNDLRWRPSTLMTLGNDIGRFYRFKNKVFVLGWDLVAESTDEGNSWTVWNTAGIPDGVPEAVWANGDTMFLTLTIYTGSGNSVSKTFRTVNKGQTWSSPLVYGGGQVMQVVKYQNRLFGLADYRLIASVNNGNSWTEVPGAPPLVFSQIFSFDHGLYVYQNYSGNSIYRTQSAVAPVWEQVHDNLKGAQITAFYTNDTMLVAAAGSGGIYQFNKTTDTWSPQNLSPTLEPIGALTVHEGRWFAGVTYGKFDSCFYISDNHGLSWDRGAIIDPPFNFSVDIDQFRCVGQHCIAFKNDDLGLQEAWISHDHGLTWEDGPGYLHQLSVHNQHFYVISPQHSSLTISDDLFDWSPLPTEGIGPGEWFEDFYWIDNDLYLWTTNGQSDTDQLYYSENSGMSWTLMYQEPTYFFDVHLMWGNHEILFRLDEHQQIIYSNNKGAQWYPLPPSEQYPRGLIAADATHLYANSYNEDRLLFRIPFSERHYRQVKVETYQDLNNNHQKDAGEPAVAGAMLRSLEKSGYVTTTDSAGIVQLTLNIAPGETDSLLVHSVLAFQYEPVHPAIPVYPSDSVIYIAFQKTAVKDFGVFMGQTRPLLPGHSSGAVLIAKNTGGAVSAGSAGTLRLLLPEIAGGFTWSPVPDAQSGDTLEWILPALLPDSTFVVKLAFLSPADATWDDHYVLQAWLQPGQPDGVASNNTALLDMFPAWSERPYWVFANKEQVAVADVASGKSGLTYCAGFEFLNAQIGQVETVDFFNYWRDFFDLNTLRIISSSHPVHFYTYANEVFNMQLLPDNLQDTSAGDAGRCYVLFQVEPKKSHQSGDLLGHFTQTFFNLNNSFGGYAHVAVTRIVDQLIPVHEPAFIPANTLAVSPNPSTGAFRLDTGGKDAAGALLRISDMSGRVYFQSTWTGNDMNPVLPPGEYIVQLAGKSFKGQTKLIVIKK